MDFEDQIARIQSAKDLSAFVAALLHDLETNPDKWENLTLPHFLESMSAWLADHKFSDNPAITPESWRLAAHILVAASIYE
jgi:hypothetical protein